MMQLTDQLQRMLRDSFRVNPLQAEELRRVEGLGELYASLNELHDLPYQHQFTLLIDGINHRFYRKTLDETTH